MEGHFSVSVRKNSEAEDVDEVLGKQLWPTNMDVHEIAKSTGQWLGLKISFWIIHALLILTIGSWKYSSNIFRK